MTAKLQKEKKNEIFCEYHMSDGGIEELSSPPNGEPPVYGATSGPPYPGDRRWYMPDLRTFLEEVPPNDFIVECFLSEHGSPDIGRKKMVINARITAQDSNKKPLMLMAIEDVTDRLSGGLEEINLNSPDPRDLEGGDDL